MQSSDSQRGSEQPGARPRIAPSGARCIPPGALAGYLQAQQAWRRSQATSKQTEIKQEQLSQASAVTGAASANSTNSCSTSDGHFEEHRGSALPALGCKSVARLFEKRHELMARHRHQRQAAKRRRLSLGVAPVGLLSLPEDVLMHTAMLLHFTYITPHRQPDEVSARFTVKKRAASRAQPASSRCHVKASAAPRALQFLDVSEISSCTEQFGLMGPFATSHAEKQ
ncbi:TPA: hypothetical protein ACH3X1_010519 [Trebouxia sp. C0004]